MISLTEFDENTGKVKKQVSYSDYGDISDGYHTFDELYDYRMVYNALWVNSIAGNPEYRVHKSERHSDGQLCFGGGWFVVSVTLPTGQVTNHYKMEYWDLFKCSVADKADEWDGHTPEQAYDRMMNFIKTR